MSEVNKEKKDQFERLKPLWDKYKSFLMKKYPSEEGEEWKFTCPHHQSIDDIMTEKRVMSDQRIMARAHFKYAIKKDKKDFETVKIPWIFKLLSPDFYELLGRMKDSLGWEKEIAEEDAGIALEEMTIKLKEVAQKSPNLTEHPYSEEDKEVEDWIEKNIDEYNARVDEFRRLWSLTRDDDSEGERANPSVQARMDELLAEGICYDELTSILNGED